MGLAKPFPAKCKPFCAICKPSYLGFSEEICKTFQEPALSHHAHYAPHNPDSNLWGHHFGSSSGLVRFTRFSRFALRLPPDALSLACSLAFSHSCLISLLFFKSSFSALVLPPSCIFLFLPIPGPLSYAPLFIVSLGLYSDPWGIEFNLRS